MKHQTLTRTDVRDVYRVLLGREPESEAVINQQIAGFEDLSALRMAVLQSPEFRSASTSGPGFSEEVSAGYWNPGSPIEYTVTADIEKQMSDRIAKEWGKLGEVDPYWSVLSHEDFRAEKIDDAVIAGFRKTGAACADLIDTHAKRANRPKPGGVCLELGCGVGRITKPLAERFDEVIAVDISAGNLELCRRYMEDEGVTNVRTVLISDVSELLRLPQFDYLFSVIVLQHNPPPVQHRMLRTLLGKLRPGGGCLFQTAADWPGYSFDAKTYLSTPPEGIEVHALPMPVVLRLMQEAGLMIDGVRMDPWLPFYGSYTFSGYRPAR